MELETKTRFTKQNLHEGARRFGVEPEQLTYIGAWQNFIYEYSKNGESYILRFTPSSHRNEKLVAAELNWIVYLAQHGVSVSAPIVSKLGNLTEKVVSGESFYFTVASFIKAKGNKIGYPECLNDTKLYQQMGRSTGGKCMPCRNIITLKMKNIDDTAGITTIIYGRWESLSRVPKNLSTNNAPL